MTIPTDEEIAVAWKGIDDDGPMADETTALTMLVLKHPHFRRITDRMLSMAVPAAGIKLADGQSVEALRPLLIGAVVSGLNYGLRIGEARAAREPGLQPAILTEMSLWAWLGEDEHGSGVIVLKQAQSASGLIPIVATRRAKAEKFQPQFEAQAKRYGKRNRFCRFAYAETVRETESGN
jgi:hypothetical protein